MFQKKNPFLEDKKEFSQEFHNEIFKHPEVISIGFNHDLQKPTIWLDLGTNIESFKIKNEFDLSEVYITCPNIEPIHDDDFL